MSEDDQDLAQMEVWVRVAPGVEVCLQPGDREPSAVDVVAAGLELHMEVAQRVARAEES